MSGVDKHTVFDGGTSSLHDEAGGMGRLGAKESETWMSNEGCSRKRELQGGDEQENTEVTAHLNLRNARSRCRSRHAADGRALIAVSYTHLRAHET